MKKRGLQASKKSLEPVNSARSMKWVNREAENKINNSRVKSQARLLSRDEHYKLQ
jgi:hypothetical protein